MEALLGFAADDGWFEQPAIAAGIELIDRTDAEANVGRVIGRYRILQLIGEGGVGSVYRAEREDGEVEGQFALKLLKRGMDSAVVLRRFRDERRILARLDHPNIARFVDAGITGDGRPYYVMEYVEGSAIHVWCGQQSLSVRQRLQLFLPVCSAVEYSHRNLVIHRDLKASNILVTAAGVPKLLDYGIATLLDRDTSDSAVDRTLAADRMLTPDYASPEQMIGSAITTATDIYSLGVLLYEILAGQRPFQLAGYPLPEMHRRVTETEAPRPSAVAPADRRKQLAGDLDTIVLKAMHRDPARRYASAERLADDITRYLSSLPVRARPDTLKYRFAKFVRRNKALALIAAASAVAVPGASFIAVYQSAVAQSRQLEAQKRFAEIRELANGLLGELDTELENLPGSTPARELLARKVLHYLDGLARDQVSDVSLQRELASAYERLGDIAGGAKASNLGNPAGALESFRKALAILQRAAARNPDDLLLLRDRARAHSRISDVLALTGEQILALEEEQRALDLRLRWQAVAPNDLMARRAVAYSLQEIAGDLDRLGRFEEALAYRTRCLSILEAVQAAAPNDAGTRMAVALANRRLSRSLLRAGRVDEAIAKARAAVAMESAEVARNPVSTGPRSALAFSLGDVGLSLMRKGEVQQALEPLAESLRIRSEISAADPRDWRAGSTLATSRLRYGMALIAAGDWRAGTAEIRASLALREQLFVRNPRNSGARGEVAEAAAALADALAARSLWAECLPLYQKAAEIYVDLRDKGSLTAELADEPGRVVAAAAAARRQVAAKQR